MARSAAASDDDVNGPSSIDSRQPSCAGQPRDNSTGQTHEQKRDAVLASASKTQEVGSSAAGTPESILEQAHRPAMSNAKQHDSAPAPPGQPPAADDLDGAACTTSGVPSEESRVRGEARGSPAHKQQRPRHYWGQALQYLEKSADVTKGPPINQHILKHLCCFWCSSCYALAQSLGQVLHAGFPSEPLCLSH